MDINVSKEQIEAIATKQIHDMMKPRIEAVLKDKYWMRQDLYEKINECIYDILKQKVDKKLPDEKVLQLVKQKDISGHIANSLIRGVSEHIVETLIEEGQNY